MYEKKVDIVALRTHHLDEGRHPIERKTIVAPEVEHHPPVVDVCISNQKRQDSDEGKRGDDAGTDGLAAHHRLELKLQILTAKAKALEECKTADGLEGCGLLLLLRNLILSITALHPAVKHQKGYEDQQAHEDEPPMRAHRRERFHHLVEEAVIHVGKGHERYEICGIDGQRKKPPQQGALRQSSHEKIPLAVDHHDQQTADDDNQGFAYRGASAKDDEGIRQKEGEPRPVVATQKRRQQECLNHTTRGQRLKQIGLQKHHRRLLDRKARTKIDQHQQGHEDEPHGGLGLAIGYRGKHHGKEDEIDGHKPCADDHHHLGRNALLIGWAAAERQVVIVAQQAE